MVAGKRLFLDTEWKKCVALYENNNNVRGWEGLGVPWRRGTWRKHASC